MLEAKDLMYLPDDPKGHKVIMVVLPNDLLHKPLQVIMEDPNPNPKTQILMVLL